MAGRASLAQRAVAEFLGTAFLLAVVIGSGVMADRLCGGNVAIALLGNTIATAGGLVALILAFAGISGAHVNPVVTIAEACRGGLRWGDVPAYLAAQVAGALAGAVLAHAMFDLPLLSRAQHVRSGAGMLLSEALATAGLLAVIWGCARQRAAAVPFAVAAYVTAGYWATASTCFANPAVTIARACSDTFAGVRPQDGALFIVAQAIGAGCATGLYRWLLPPEPAPDGAAPAPPGSLDHATSGTP